MNNVYDLSAPQWLSLSDNEASAFFDVAPSALSSLYRRLVQRWHPDRNTDEHASEVFMRIQSLYRTAQSRFAPAAPYELKDAAGRLFRYQPLASDDFVLGKFYRARQSLAYHVAPSHRELFDRAVSRLSSLSFATPAMRQSLSPLLPEMVAHPWGVTGGLMVLRHAEGSVRLGDLYRHAGPLDPRHVAWILSGLFNLTCYLQSQSIAHHAIDLDAVWIHPGRHEVALLGGWFFARTFGQPVDVLPSATAALASPRYLASKIAGPGLDGELVRAVGRELLGDRQGLRLPVTLPAPLRRFLVDAPFDSAIEDYKTWKKVLTASFGPPTFVPMNFSASEIYKETHHG